MGRRFGPWRRRLLRVARQPTQSEDAESMTIQNALEAPEAWVAVGKAPFWGADYKHSECIRRGKGRWDCGLATAGSVRRSVDECAVMLDSAAGGPPVGLIPIRPARILGDKDLRVTPWFVGVDRTPLSLPATHSRSACRRRRGRPTPQSLRAGRRRQKGTSLQYSSLPSIRNTSPPARTGHS